MIGLDSLSATWWGSAILGCGRAAEWGLVLSEGKRYGVGGYLVVRKKMVGIFGEASTSVGDCGIGVNTGTGGVGLEIFSPVALRIPALVSPSATRLGNP
jgi:hypothetical protein